MQASKSFLYILICLTIVFGFVTPASAVEQTPDNPRTGEILTKKLAEANDAERIKIWEGLSQKEKDSVIEYSTVVKIESEDVFEPISSHANLAEITAAGGCSVRGLKEKGYNAFGQVLWEYYSRVEWCYDGTNVTSKFATRTGKAGPFPSLWEYMGDAVSPVQSGGVGKTYYRIWVNGYFKLAIAGWPIQTAYPWIDITVRGNGTSTATSGQ